MKYKLIATDLDGTLGNSQSQITKGNIDAIKEITDKGMHFAICSGRSQASVSKFNKSIGMDKPGCYGISFNGGVVYRTDNMEVLFEHRLERENALQVIEIIKKSDPKAPIMVYAGDNLIYHELDGDDILGYTTRSGIYEEKIGSFGEALKGDVLKVILRWEHDKLSKLASDICDKVKPYCEMFFSDKTLLEFSPTGLNKSIGIKFLADYLNIHMEEVVAIGDNYNDMEMIKAAGFGVAVKNAVDEVKKIADYVTEADNDNDAIKEVIDAVIKKL